MPLLSRITGQVTPHLKIERDEEDRWGMTAYSPIGSANPISGQKKIPLMKFQI